MQDGALRITVTNSIWMGTALNLPDASGAGVGIENVRHRLQAVFGKRASLTAGPVDDKFVATISIPNVTMSR
jgi:sensor histidine kinase YesM